MMAGRKISQRLTQSMSEIATTRPYHPRTFTKRTRQRFYADRTAQLVRHLGREPTYPEKIVISRCVAIEWELLRMDQRIDAGEELSGHALRARLAGENRLRLDLQALGIKPPQEVALQADPLGAIHARFANRGEAAE